MSYDIRIGVQVKGTDLFAVIGRPERDSPTYNLGEMFRACTGWDFEQDKWYKCDTVIDNIAHGICELNAHRERYVRYLPVNGWGTIGNAIETLTSLWDCIFEMAEKIPFEYLWVKW